MYIYGASIEIFVVPILTSLGSLLLLCTEKSRNGSIPLTSLWFLWSVLGASLALGFAIKRSSSVILQSVLVVLGFVFVAILPCSTMNMYMYPYFVIGYLYSRNRACLNKYFNVVAIISLFIYIVMIFMFKKCHYIYTTGLFRGGVVDSINIDLFRWIIGFVGSISVVWVCKNIYSLLKERIVVGIECLGKESLAIYALSVPLLSGVLSILSDKLNSLLFIDWKNNILLYSVCLTPVLTIIYSVVLLWIISKMKKYNVYRLIFGR